MYKIIKIKPISKFNMTDIGRDFTKMPDESVDFSGLFWYYILSEEFGNDFILKDYLESKKLLSKDSDKDIENNIRFVLNKAAFIKERINIRTNNNIPRGEDVFFSFNIFTKIQSYVNEFYDSSDLQIGMKEGVFFHKEMKNINDLSKNIAFYKKSPFFVEMILPLLKKHFKKEKNLLYKFEIFWPNELILVGVMGSLLKDINPDAKIIIDFSGGNEQFDFTQWVSMIRESGGVFFKHYDFVIIDRDFSTGIKLLQSYLNGKIKMKELKNVMLYENKKVYYNEIIQNDVSVDIFGEFIKETFTGKNLGVLLGETACYARFLPYKCYWSKCNFCAINSQNKFTYNEEYSYKYFIDKWIKYINEHNIKSVHFRDEALPPSVIIMFAKRVIKEKIEINYQVRTRFEDIYTYKNCKILAESGCGFMGMGLESAVERINEEVGNKGNTIAIKDKLRIIHNFDRAGIAFHNYSIMGFPGETEQESAMTYKFLKTNIVHSNFYTCTPNTFGLMKGPEIFTNREKYGIEVNEEELSNPFTLIYNFSCHGKKRNMALLEKFVDDIHKAQFLPWLGDSPDVMGKLFWEYIDRSSIFYFLKRYHSSNPFYTFMHINREVLKKDFIDITNMKFEVSPYFQVLSSQEGKVYLHDWVGCKQLFMEEDFIPLLNDYNNSKPLSDNLKLITSSVDSNIEGFVYYLLENRLLLDVH